MPVVLVEGVSMCTGRGGPVLASCSPNGRQIASGHDSRASLAPGCALHVTKADGSEVWQVPNTADAYDPAWR